MMKLVVFDLDYTIWQPEMYQLYSAPKLRPIDPKTDRRLSPSVLEEARTIKEGYILAEIGGSPMRIFNGA
jgi:Acid Phosphatase